MDASNSPGANENGKTNGKGKGKGKGKEKRKEKETEKDNDNDKEEDKEKDEVKEKKKEKGKNKELTKEKSIIKEKSVAKDIGKEIAKYIGKDIGKFIEKDEGKEPGKETEKEPEKEGETEKAKEKKKRKHKKKKSRLARKMSVSRKNQTKMAEELKLQYIKQRQEFLREAKKRVHVEWERNEAKLQVYQKEFDQRQEAFKYSYERLSLLEKVWENLELEERINQEWLLYLSGNHSTSVQELNSYVYLLTEVEKNNQMPFCIKQTDEILKLLEQMQEVLDCPGPALTERFLVDLKQLRIEVRNLLQEIIDRTTFNLFSRIETDMVSINVSYSRYTAKCPHFKMSLWAELISPVPAAPGHIIKVNFEDCDVTVFIPAFLINIPKVMRAMWLMYDHWSDMCRTYECPPLPSYYKMGLYELIISHYKSKVEILDFRDKLSNTMKKKIGDLPSDATLSQELIVWDSEPQRPVSEELIYRDCLSEYDLGKQIKSILNEYEINLRERIVLGDLLLLEVLQQPPQPKYLRFKHNVTLREVPPKLYPVEFYVKFLGGQKKETEETEEKKREFSRKAEQEEARKLIAVHVKLYQSIVWFEIPLIAIWDPVHNYWTTENVHDVFYEEEEELMTFKTGCLGLMGFHVYRYCNFPYLSWLLQPGNEGVDFILKTQKADFVFEILESEVCIKSMENIPGNAMDWIVGKYYKPAELVKKLTKGGIIISPAPDASSYIKDIQAKHYAIENNIYQVFGLFCDSFSFKRSKFNQAAGRDTMIFQAQEINKKHQIDYCLIYAKFCSCFILEINENDENFSTERASCQQEYIDLYSLLHKNCTENAKRNSDSISSMRVKTVKEFLELIRPLSYS